MTSLLLVLLMAGVNGGIISRNYLDLASFPHDVPSDVTVLNAQHNKIKEVDFIEPFIGLKKLHLSYNLLTAFPNLVNVSGSLKRLALDNNKISHISPEYFDHLEKLVFLIINHNPVNTIPNVPGPGNTLSTLYATNTAITSVPRMEKTGRTLRLFYLDYNAIKNVTYDDIAQFPKLFGFYIKSNALTTLPNLCKLDNSQRESNHLILFVSNNNFYCDEKMYWIRQAQIQNNISFIFPLQCSGPPALAGTYLTAYNPNGLVAKDTDKETIYQVFQSLPNPEHFGCYPVITEVLHNESVLGCGARCMETDKCRMFAVDDGTCVVTQYPDVASGSAEGFLSYTNWYLVK